MKTLFKKKQGTQDKQLELLELKKDLKKFASVVLEDAAEIDVFFEDQLQKRKNQAAITPKANWSIVKRQLEEWAKLDVVTG